MAMTGRRLFVTGFGPFPGVERNPSREIALALARRGLGLDVEIIAAELPVTFADVAAAIDAALERMPHPPDVILGLGVWGNGDSFRLERRARGVFDTTRPDNAGATGAGIDLGRERSTDWDLDPLAECMRAAGAGLVRISDDAGSYVCERTYLHLLERAEKLGARALFLHVPPIAIIDLERQIACVTALAHEMCA